MAQRMTMAEAVSLLHPWDSLGVPLGPGQPGGFLHALAERDDWEDLQVFSALLVDLYAVFTKPGVHLRSGFFGPAERLLREAGADIEFVPSDFRRFVQVAERIRSRVVATAVAPPDADGHLSLSLHAGATVAELNRAAADPGRVLVAEVNPGLPRTLGLPPEHPHRLHVDEVDVLVESDRPVFTIADGEATDVERAIAEHVRPFIIDGSTLQTGIGGVPSLVVSLLADGPGGGYGIHSEMFTTGLMHLHEAGKVTNRDKGVFDGVSVCTFAAGTAELYAWLDGNPDVRFLPVDVVNAPHTIAKNHRMVTINGALAIDLYGQVVADRIGDRQFSGIGGHEDFVAMSGLQLEDRSLVCLPSTATVDGSVVPRIVTDLAPGSTVTTPRHQLDVVVTEHGVAELRGCTVRERAVAIASIAHPDHRPELLTRARSL